MTSQEHLDILRQGVKAWNQWRQEHPDIQPNLSGANLVNADLSGTHLRGANLSGADLSDANLTEARVGWTVFGDVDLSIVKGLETLRHQGPSTIGIDTIYRSHGNFPEAFLKCAGVDDTFITY